MPTKKPSHAEAAEALLFEKGLPSSVEAESLCLGSVILDDSKWEILTGIIGRDSFSLEANKRIFAAMERIKDRGERIHRVSVADDLMREGQLESIGGLTYLVSLDETLPEIVDLASYAKIVLEKAHLRAIIFSSQRAIDQALNQVGPAKDIASAAAISLETVQAGRLDENEGGRTPEQIVNSFPAPPGVPPIQAFLDPSMRKRGLPTGFRKLDEMLGGGLQDSELIVLAARPSIGKSAMAVNICQNISLHPRWPKRTDIFSLEMSGESLLVRMLCSIARVDQNKFRAGYLGTQERHALQVALDQIISSPIRIHDEFKKNLPALVRRIRKASKDGSKLIAIDYAQLMVTGAKSENRNLEIAEICRTLKLLTLELGTPILLLSQIGRSAEKRGGDMRPQMSDMKDSGSIEESADTILTLYRAEIYKKDDVTLKGIADLDIIKQRNGAIGRIPLRFLGQFIKFENRAEDTAFPEENDSEDSEPPPSAPISSDNEW